MIEMLSRLTAKTTWTLLGFALALSGCTDVGLQLDDPPPIQRFDNLLRVRGEFCTQPDTQIEFPVRVLFVVDQSASLQCTDSRNRRQGALRSLVDDLLRSPVTRVGVVGFSSWARELDFTRDRSQIMRNLNPGELGVATDYQGALAAAVRVLEREMVEQGPADRARTRYVMVYVSDGVPEPRCNAGCEDDRTACMDGLDNDGDGRTDGSDPDCMGLDDATMRPDILYGICNTRQSIPDGEYVDFRGLCPAYNQPEQLLQRVSDIMSLRDVYATGPVNINTVLLFSPQEVVEMTCPGAAEAFGYDRMQAMAVLRSIARAGRGVFRDVNLATAEDGFLQFDFQALEAEQWLASIVAYNTNARPAEQGYAVDTDRDGLPDDLEFEIGTDLTSRDSDHDGPDGYGDLIEYRLRNAGFDPVDNTAPASPCTANRDEDGDGILTCEENFLGTNPRHPDSDGDGMNDWLELASGTDPARHDSLEDSDFDGILNGAELLGGSNPRRTDAPRYRDERVQYRVSETGRREVLRWGTDELEERECYEFDIRDLQLVTPVGAANQGINRIMVYAHEQPASLAGARSETHVACFEAAFLGDTHKDPESGLIDARGPAWTELLVNLQAGIDSLLSCPWFDPEAFTRGAIVNRIDECLPEDIQLGRFQYPESDIIDLVRTYVATNTAVNIRNPAPELFVSITDFDPEAHCHRPWEFERLTRLFGQIVELCGQCDSPAPTEDDPAAPFRSPCCAVDE